MVSNIFNALVLSRYCLPDMSHGGEFFSNKIILNLILATCFLCESGSRFEVSFSRGKSFPYSLIKRLPLVLVAESQPYRSLIRLLPEIL